MSMTGSIALSAAGKDFAATTDSEMDIQVQPMLCKSNMDITIDADGKQVQQSVVQYMERTGKQIMTYSYVNGTWQRLAFPGGDYNPARQLGDFVKALKVVDLVSEDENSAVYEVTADGKYLKETIKKNLNSAGLSKMGLADMFSDFTGDFTYGITVDKNIGIICGMDMDLSPFVAALGSRMADQMTASQEKRQEMIDMFNNAQVKMSISLSGFDAVEPFTVPDEARGD
jgi:hypothetical protein